MLELAPAAVAAFSMTLGAPAVNLESDERLALQTVVQPAPAAALEEPLPSVEPESQSGGADFAVRLADGNRLPKATGNMFDQARAIPLEAGGLALGITAIGVANWNWGSSGFHFDSEGWFGRETSSFGVDKVGHAYSTYVMTEFLGAAIRGKAQNGRGAQLTAAALSMALMTYVEVFDGFSGDHGFSWEDLVADAAGAGLSILRHTVPGLNDKLDFRLEYLPSGNVGFRPLSDYSGQRYIFALKLAGFDKLEDTPLRFVELQGGYHARGFSERDRKMGVEPRRALFVGLGFNLQQLLSRDRGSGSNVVRSARSVLEYVQVPYTAIYSR